MRVGKNLVITIEAATIGASVTYPDGSLVQLTMPKPPDLNEHAAAQAEAIIVRLVRRLLVVAAKDLAYRHSWFQEGGVDLMTVVVTTVAIWEDSWSERCRGRGPGRIRSTAHWWPEGLEAGGRQGAFQ